LFEWISQLPWEAKLLAVAAAIAWAIAIPAVKRSREKNAIRQEILFHERQLDACPHCGHGGRLLSDRCGACKLEIVRTPEEREDIASLLSLREIYKNM
jgi:hypothetical protein